jgi:hypothetical protein
MWRWKPDGEVTLRYAQDAQGSPLPLMQDPLHYPHGTKFMAPGEAGQPARRGAGPGSDSSGLMRGSHEHGIMLQS